MSTVEKLAAIGAVASAVAAYALFGCGVAKRMRQSGTGPLGRVRTGRRRSGRR